MLSEGEYRVAQYIHCDAYPTGLGLSVWQLSLVIKDGRVSMFFWCHFSISYLFTVGLLENFQGFCPLSLNCRERAFIVLGIIVNLHTGMGVNS